MAASKNTRTGVARGRDRNGEGLNAEGSRMESESEDGGEGVGSGEETAEGEEDDESGAEMEREFGEKEIREAKTFLLGALRQETVVFVPQLIVESTEDTKSDFRYQKSILQVHLYYFYD